MCGWGHLTRERKRTERGGAEMRRCGLKRQGKGVGEADTAEGKGGGGCLVAKKTMQKM